MERQGKADSHLKIKHDSQGPRTVHECEDCKPLPFEKFLSKHTQTPWKVKQNSWEIQGDSTQPIAGDDGIILGFISDQNLKDHSIRDANAAFIVKAVNCHEELLSSFGDLIALIEDGSMPTDDELKAFKRVIAKAEGV